MQVSYDDGMTDRQYARHIERQQDLMEAEQAAATAKAEKAAYTVFVALAGVITALQKIKREDGSLLAQIFIDKPPRAIYPDYYQLIPQPIALKQILTKLKKADYTHFENVEQDFALLCHNARTYNLDTSPVYADAELLRREFYTRAAPVLRKFGITPPAECPPLPPFSHLIYPPEYAPRLVLSPYAVAEEEVGDADDGEGGDVGASAKKGKGAARRKRTEDGEGPGSAPPKKRVRVSTSSSSAAMDALSYPEPSASGLSLSLKKPPRLVLPAAADVQAEGLGMSRSTSNNTLTDEGENQLFLSFSLKGRK